MIQILPQLQNDGTVFERHVYSSVSNNAYTDIYYKKENNKYYIKKESFGDPLFETYDWQEILPLDHGDFSLPIQQKVKEWLDQQ